MSDLAKARRLLSRAGAWIDSIPNGYGLRMGGNRRARVVHTFKEDVFRELVAQPGLRLREGGGWTARSNARPNDSQSRQGAPEPGRPGVIDGMILVPDTHGRLRSRRANLGQSPIAWLARHKDKDGQPWLKAAHIAAAERLSRDAELSMRGASLTMRWDALPRSRGGSATRAEPGDQALTAGQRVEAALNDCGNTRAILVAICIRASTLQCAEQDLGLRRRSGKALLVKGLCALAAHYRIG